MYSSPVLRPQNQNKIRADFVGKENNKMTWEPKPFKFVAAPHKDAENQDPRSSENVRKAPVRAGVSRLPVLSKGIHLQTASADFSRSQGRWEEKPLTGKAKKKKPCTRPVPFNLSQPKISVNSTSTPQPLNVLQSRSCPVQSENTTHGKTQTNNAKLTKHSMLKSNEDSSKKKGRSHGTTKDKTSHLSGHTLKTCAPSNDCTETCLDGMNLLTLKDPSKTSHSSQNAQSNFSKASSEKMDKFTPNHAALLSFLRNEGETTRVPSSATPQSKLYVTCPQRVSVTQSHQKAASATGSLKSMQFSPDAAALRSILENEGIKAAVSLGARSSMYPSGRGTSIYTAQRVPVRKTQTESTGGPHLTIKNTPQNKWTPQRVRNTRHQPMSSMKWHTSMQQSPFINTPGLRRCNTKQPQQEEVVQQLFNDPDDEQSTSKDSDSQAQHLPVKVSTCEENDATSATSTDKDEEKDGLQPFLQAVQRESVIFFSTGKKLVRAPLFERQDTSEHQKQHDVSPSEQGDELRVHEGMSEPICQNQPPVTSLHKDPTLQKPRAINPALALLRKRLPPLEELRLDEEVATYTAASGPVASGFLPPRPRCGNPLASILHFEESTRFVPLSFDLLSGLSLLQET